MSQRIQIPINGITTTSVYTEGDTYSLVNLRPKNGALHPVSPRKIMQKLSQKYDIIFVHQNNDYKNWIGIVNDNGYSSIYWDIRDQQPTSISSYMHGSVNSIQQIGNTLSLITEDNIYYLFYQNNKYIFLGEIPQIPVITLKTSDKMSSAELYFINEYGSGTIDKDGIINATKGLINKTIDRLVNGYTDENGTFHEGSGLQLFDACFIRYAFRLYDGTLTKHSPPILVMPVKNILSLKTITYMVGNGGVLGDDSKVGVHGYRIYMSYDFANIEGGFGDWRKWEDIIKSVDIFMSPPLGISSIENIKNIPFEPSSFNPNHPDPDNLITEITKENIKNISEASSFYLIKSIPLGKEANIFEPDELPSSESNISKMEDLVHQEVMTDDNFSHHKYGAGCSYAYNNRLHIANIKTSFFKGFNPDYFLWDNTADTADGNYNGFKYTDAPGELYNNLLMEIEIDLGITTEKVYSSLAIEATWPIYKMFMSGFISYPDPRAKKITIYRNSGPEWYKVFSKPLEKHNTLNLSYYLSEGLTPIIENGKPVSVEQLDTSKTISISEPNKIKVSELNNPLYFPNVNTYQTGAGAILSMATNAMNVSDRNYGQYPLYVFTTQGIWTLNVGSGEVVYSTQTAPAYTEAPTTGVVGETPYGVAFTTQRGLFIINGQSVDFISPQIEQKPLELNIEMNSHCNGVVFAPEHRKFSELLKHVSALIFNPYENELIINSKESEYNYILNFNNQQFYQSTEKITLFADNAFPELFAVDDTTLKDYSSAESPLTHVSFILRPLQYGTPDIKHMERMILNALLYNVTNLGDSKFSLAMSHYSNDGVNFLAAKGYPVNEGNRKDFDMGLFTGTKSRQFLYVFSGVIDEKSQIFNIDAVLEKEYNNTKMR